MADAFRPYEGNDPYIFISYGRKDRDRVFPLLDALHDAGYRIWRDEGGIPWGVRWMETIEDHISRAAVCLVFWSEAFAASQHCEAETAEMIAEQKTIVMAFLDDTPVRKGLRMYLRRFQSVKLSDFDSDTDFVERLAREPVFVPCKAETPPDPVPQKVSTPPAPRIPADAWNMDGKIQWYLDEQGVLTIAKNKDLRERKTVPMPDYTWDEHDRFCSVAPWIRSWKTIRSVVIRNDIGTIGRYAFYPCMSMTSVTIPDSVTIIGDFAFHSCRGLTSVTVPDSVTAIGGSAFYGCRGLTSVTIPDSVTAIGGWAFYGCAGLTSVTIPDSVTSISEQTFVDCAGLTSVTIPDSVTSIGDWAFSGCTGLTSITIPDSVTSIGWQAFDRCTGLTSVSIPAGMGSGLASFPDDVQIIRRPPRCEGS